MRPKSTLGHLVTAGAAGLLVAAAVSWPTVAHRADRRGQMPPAQSQPQFRAAVELVQLDVSVLDRDRRPVLGLKAADFTILEDGVKHAVDTFSEIVLPDPEPSPTPWMHEVAPDVRRNDENMDKRLTVIVMDDMTIPFDIQILNSAKDIARKVVDRMGPADLTAVVFTRSNREAQDYTNDRARLLQAIDTFSGGGRDLDPRDECVQEHYFLSAIGTLRRASELLAAVPQRRKTLIYVSVGVPFDPEAAGEPVLAAGVGTVSRRELHSRLRSDIESIFREAQRANVNIYSVNPGGLGGLQFAVQRAMAGPQQQERLCSPVPGRAGTAEGQATLHADFLHVVSENTGGRAFVDTNEFDTGVAQIFRENGSYYLIGYRSTNLKRNGGFRRLEVKVNRPGVEVRARRGYYAENDRDTDRRAEAAPALDLALAGLLPKGDVAMQVSAMPLVKPGSPDSTVAIVLGLREPAPGGLARVTTDVKLSVHAFTPEGQARGSHQMNAELTLRPVAGVDAQYEVLSQIDLRPGRYQLRLAAESTMQGKTGSVFYDVDVPDFDRARLSMSGIAVAVDPALVVSPRDRLAALLPVIPTTQRDFLRGDRVTAFLRVYQSSRSAPVPVTIDARVLDSSGRVVFGGPQKLEAGRFTANRAAEPAMPQLARGGRPSMAAPRSDPAAAGPHAAELHLDLPVFTFSPGPHVLVVEAGNGREAVRRDVRFQMR